MAKKQNKYSQWIAAEFKRTGKKKNALAKVLGIDPSGITRRLAKGDNLKVDELAKIKEFFNNDDPHAGPFDSGIKEIDVRGGLGGGGIAMEGFAENDHGELQATDAIKESWGIPERYIRNELRVTPSNVKIIEVLGDSMEPSLRSGDRVFIDLNHTSPSPPGIYAVYDGFGLVVKRIEYVPRSAPAKVRLISDNTHHSAYEVTLEEAKIVGRVICKISPM